MNKQKEKMLWIKFPFWLGAAADALWAVALFTPKVFGILISNSDFNPEVSVRLIMGIARSLVTGRTLLLLWVIRMPRERRAVILLTDFPVVCG